MIVGHDMRLTSLDLAEAFADGVRRVGRDVLFLGLAATLTCYKKLAKLAT